MPKSTKDFDSVKTWGLVICVRLSKTIQFRERQLLIPVMRLPKRHPLSPVQAYERHISAFPAPPALPAFLLRNPHHPLRLYRQPAQGFNTSWISCFQILRTQFSPWWRFVYLPLWCARGTDQPPRGLVFRRGSPVHCTAPGTSPFGGETYCSKYARSLTFFLFPSPSSFPCFPRFLFL